MTPHEIRKLIQELCELAELHDPAFSAPTQSQRVCREAADAISDLAGQLVAKAVETKLQQPDAPDMFWPAEDPERPYENPGDYFNDENVFGEPVEFQRAIQRANTWGVAIPTKHDDDGIVEDFDLHWFDSEAEAIAFCEAQKRGEGLPLIDAGK